MSFDVLTMGETMMAFEAQDFGPLRENSIYRKWIGGAEDNFIIGLARLGFQCGWFSRLGNDEFGRAIVRTIRGEGVDISRVIIDQDAPTGVFFVNRESEGDPHCYYYRTGSAASHLSRDDIDEEYVSSATIVYLTGITPAISPSAQEATERIVDLTVQNGQTLVFDPNLRLKLWDIGKAREVLLPLMRKSDYVLPGGNELVLLMDTDDLDTAIDKAHAYGMTRLLIKQGAEGAIVAVTNNNPVRVPAFSLKKPVSTMGAGDCFAAGFVAGLLREQALEECARWGNAMGAFCLRGWGPYHTLPEFDELQSFLEGRRTITR
jgi:2-dehydro-3-deoxygluconokinase